MNYTITGVFGKPGAGKTTFLTSFVVKNEFNRWVKSKFKIIGKLPCFRVYKRIYSNDDSIVNTVWYDSKSLGHWKPEPDSLVLMSEAGVYWNNRNSMKCDPAAQRFWARHRHLKCDVVWESQTVDVDIKLRQRTGSLWILQKSMLSNCSFMKKIKFKLGVNNDTKKIEELYSTSEGWERIISLIVGDEKWFYRRFFYKYFDTFCEDGFAYDMEAPVSVRSYIPAK